MKHYDGTLLKYHDGKLRDERDSTLRLKLVSQKRKLTWVEYIPLIILCLLITVLLVRGIFYGM